jgi:hypothetical protein
MRNRAYLIVALLGLLTFALAPGYAAAAVQGQNLTEIALASDAAARASVVSATIDVNPLAADLGTINIGASASTIFVITNGGDFDLMISAVDSSNPQFSVVSFPAVVAAGGSGNMTVSYNPTTGTNESGVITIHSNASNGASFPVNVSGEGNAAPTLAAIGDKTAPADLPLNFSAVGTDNGDQVDDILTYSVSPALPPGATFNTNTGAFAWTPTSADEGTYTLTFCVSDGSLNDCETIDITVTATNAKPVADAGGPYTAGANSAIQFNGTGSSDPDGDNLTYAWNFGDGSPTVITGPTPTHAYALLGNYLVSLTVTDDGSPVLSSDPDLASVQIINALPGGLVVKVGNGGMRIHGGSNQRMGLELASGPPSNIDVATVRLSTTAAGAGTVSQISPLAKGVTIGDLDGDNVPELDVVFSRTDLELLLGNVSNNAVITLVMTANTTLAAGGLPIRAEAQVKIKNTGPTAVSAFAAPNPFNPATSVKYTLRKGGEVSVRIFSLDGRLVKTLVEGPAAAGTHEVLWDGRDNGGNSVRSGMYFVKTTSGGESAVFKLSLLK